MANWMLGKAPWEPVTTQNLQYAQTRDANGHLSGGWVSKRKGTWKKNPRTEMRELINANGQHYKVPVLDASDFLDARALGTFDNMIDRSATDEQALLAFIKDSEGTAVEQNGTGHILKLAYSLANQTLLVTFNNEKHGSDIVAYFRVPVEVWSELQVLAQDTGAGQLDDRGNFRHILGIRFWDLVRIRGSVSGSKFAFTYLNDKSGSESYSQAISKAKDSGFTNAQELEKISGATQEEQMYNYLFTMPGHNKHLIDIMSLVRDKGTENNMTALRWHIENKNASMIFKLAAKFDDGYSPEKFFTEEAAATLEGPTDASIAASRSKAQRRTEREAAEERKKMYNNIQAAGAGSLSKEWSESAQDTGSGSFNASNINGSEKDYDAIELRKWVKSRPEYYKGARGGVGKPQAPITIPNREEAHEADIIEEIHANDNMTARFAMRPSPFRERRGNYTGIGGHAGGRRPSAISMPTTQGNDTHRRTYREIYMEQMSSEQWHDWDRMSDKERVETVKEFRKTLAKKNDTKKNDINIVHKK